MENLSTSDPVRSLPAAEAVKAAPLQLKKAMTVGHVFQLIAANCLAQILANAAGVRRQDGESVHQMRVGLRRLRSAIGLFKAVLLPNESLKEELDWLTRQLGMARDWDILAGPVLSALTDELDEPLPIEYVRQAASRQAKKNDKSAAAAVSSPRYERLVLSLTQWINQRGWRDKTSASQQKRLKSRISPFADEMLKHYRRRLKKHGKKLAGAAPTERHKVRIAAKKTRYSAEFFQSLYVDKTMAPFVTALTGLQDTLGRLNDAATAGGLLRQLQESHPPLAETISYLRGYLAAGAKGEDHNIQRCWQAFKPLKTPLQA
ncbi:CHAD domain-containing protein [Sodalis ligni]|uniref:CHAD domain-containing protein n=1 Tax=Sodalis ligni TaxID=2697027 RepID=UPI00193F02C3|nr:CHAD domain-containing protein [Sodalis ligni]QWA12944.1 CHAD domain-containing protein [Sodalis ligni]